MNRSDKFSIVFGFLLEAIAVFFICTILMQFFAFGEQQPAVFKIGAVLFQAYGYSSILVPLCMFAAGLLVFTGLCTLRWSIYLACSVFPFVTVVFAEKIAKHFLTTDTSALLGFKIAAIFAVAGLAVAIEYVLIGMFSDYFLARKAWNSKKNVKDDIPLNAFSKETSRTVSEKVEEPEVEPEIETLAFETTNILNGSETETLDANKEEPAPETAGEKLEQAEKPAEEADKDNVTFIIPQYVPYGEQIAKKGSVWKNYSKIGDYIRKTPNKGTPAEENESENKEEKIEKEAIQELDKENEEKQILPIQSEEEPVFVNFKRILVDAPIVPDDNAEPAKPDAFSSEESPIEALHKSLQAKALQQEAEKIAETEIDSISEDTAIDSVNKVNSNIAANSYIDQIPEVEIEKDFTSSDEAAFLENPFDELPESCAEKIDTESYFTEPVQAPAGDVVEVTETSETDGVEESVFEEPQVNEIKYDPAPVVEDTIEELETVVEDAVEDSEDYEEIIEEPEVPEVEEILDVDEVIAEPIDTPCRRHFGRAYSRAS